MADPGVPVDEELLVAAGDSLRVVASFGVGYDHIDVDAARARGIRVTNTPEVLTNATAELAVTLMLAAARRVAEGDALVRAQRWRGWGPEDFLGRELAGATVGLVGFGRIARRVAELLSGFDVRLLYTSRSPRAAPPQAERCELDDLLRTADVVSMHAAANLVDVFEEIDDRYADRHRVKAGSPAGPRCTASAAGPRWSTASSETTTASRTGRSGSTSRSCS